MSDDAKRLLIVDDDDGIRQSLARIMRCKGFEVQTACDGESAVAMAAEFQPRLVILDIRMPGIDGVEAFERIRAEHPQIAGIFMTAYAASARVSDALHLGAISVLSKPLDMKALVELVDQSLRHTPVLIVDDDVDFLREVAETLRNRRIPASTAANIAAAIGSLRRQPRQVVLVTGGGSSPTWELEHQYFDAIEYVSKPIDLEDLIRRVDQLSDADRREGCHGDG